MSSNQKCAAPKAEEESRATCELGDTKGLTIIMTIVVCNHTKKAIAAVDVAVVVIVVVVFGMVLVVVIDHYSI